MLNIASLITLSSLFRNGIKHEYCIDQFVQPSSYYNNDNRFDQYISRNKKTTSNITM